MLGRSSAVVLLAGIAVMPIQSTSSPQNEWVPLFDGKTLTGWRGYKKPDASSTRWKIEEGSLTVGASGGSDTPRSAGRHQRRHL